MPRILYSEQIEEVMRRPVFGVKDLVDLGVPYDYARLRLHLLSTSGRIMRVERGKYSISDDAVMIATHLTEPCYLSLWSALNARGLTTQIPFSIQVVTSRKRFSRRLSIAGSEVRFYQEKAAMMFGYEFIPFDDDQRIPMARLEKIVIDAIYLRAIPVGELEEAMEGVDRDLLLEYSELTYNDRVIAVVKELCGC